MQKLLLIIFLFLAQINAAVATGKYPFTVKETGSGPAIIFIPGFACSADVWNETVEKFKSNQTCYVLNMAGFAGVPGEDNPEIQIWVKQIAQFIQDKEIKHPVIVGHSLGGTMALMLAADYPLLISKIVVVDALPCLPAISNLAFEVAAKPDCAKFVNSFTGMDKAAFYQMQRVTMASMVADTGYIETVVQWSMQSNLITMGQIYCQLLNTDLRTKIKTIQCPTLVLLEPGFKALQDSVSDQYKNLEGGQLHYADKGLHFIMYDDKAWYFAELKNFIQ